MTEAIGGSVYHQEEAVPGQVLENYIRKIPSDDGKFVKVVSHSERIELIPQPPTEEEIAERKRQEALTLKIVIGAVIGFFGFIGAMSWLDQRTYRQSLEESPEQADG